MRREPPFSSPAIILPIPLTSPHVSPFWRKVKSSATCPTAKAAPALNSRTISRQPQKVKAPMAPMPSRPTR